MIYTDLPCDDVTERGDEVSFDNGVTWKPVPIVGILAYTGVNGLRYRRPAPVQQQTQFLRAAVSSLESDRLRAILAKESEHVAVIQANNRDRDRANGIGQELRLLQENFARSFRDRVFIVGNRVIDTDNGTFSVRIAEVVA